MTFTCTSDNMTPLSNRVGCFLAILTLALLLQPGAVAARDAVATHGHTKHMLHHRHLLQTNTTRNPTNSTASNSTSNSTTNSTSNSTSINPTSNSTSVNSTATSPPNSSPSPSQDQGSDNVDNGDGISNQQLISNQQVNLSPGAVAGIVIGCIVAGAFVIGGTIFVFFRFRRHGGMEQTGSGAPGTTNPRLNLPELNALHDLTKAGDSQQVPRAPGI